MDVVGVKGRRLDNIMSRLRIYRYSSESNLSDNEIRRLHQLAKEDITSALQPYGHYSVSVRSSLEEVDTVWQARYEVDVGEPVVISSFSLAVSGEDLGLEVIAEPASFFTINQGDILNQVLYEQGKKALLRHARSLGYLDAVYKTQEIRVYRQKNIAEIELLLDTGPRYLFGETTSEQLVITDSLFYRYLDYEQGDDFSRQKLYDLQRDLYRTDFFKTVMVEALIDQPEGKGVPVVVRVDPLDHYNRYSFGVGWATDKRAYVLLEWENKLLNQYGHRANSSLLFGELEKHIRASYIILAGDPRYNSMVFTGLWNEELWDDTITKLYSFSTAYEYETPKIHYAFSLEIREEDYRVGDTKGTSLLLMPYVQGSLALADDIVNTSNGLRATVYLTGASDDVVSDTTFLKSRAEGKMIVSPFKNWRVIGRASMGGILVDSIEDVPPSLRFYAGGSNSVRGYRYKTLGPEDESGTVIGGTFLLTGSIEAERRITDLWLASLFYDVGNATDDLTIDLAHGVGCGVGLVLPFGQIRLDFAYPLSDQGSSQYVYLTVGTDL